MECDPVYELTKGIVTDVYVDIHYSSITVRPTQ